jgi:paraquat-inducible protein B
MVWIIPVLAALVAAGIAIQRVAREGPTVTIVFRSAQGIEAGKSFIKYKDVNIGLVTAVQLSDDFSKVEVKAKIARSAAGLMVEDAQFWVVRPRISVGEISGLGTLLSGTYIGFGAGKSETSQQRFTGLEVPRVVTGGAPGREFVLKVSDLGGLSTGSPIYYRHVPVGQVVSYDFIADGKMVELKVFVDAPYDRYVHAQTRFWNASGVALSVSASGVALRTESLAALLSGGIAFDTPAFTSSIDPAAAQTIFTLHPDRDTAMRQPDGVARDYVLYFAEPLNGLSVGAPVMFLGLPAGEVTAVGLTHDPVTLDVRPRVDITLFPERLIARLPEKQQSAARAADQNLKQSRAILRHLFDERGMRAQLRSASLVTSQRYVALDYFPAAPKTKTDWNRDAPELPVMRSTLPDIEDKLVSVLAKLDKVPLDAIGANLNRSLESLDQTLKDTRKLVGRLDAQVVPKLETTLEHTSTLVSRFDTEIAPDLRTTLEETRRAVVAAERVMSSAQTMLVGPDAPAQQQLRDTLQEVTRAARAVRVLADSLERHPEALIRGRTEQQSAER